MKKIAFTFMTVLLGSLSSQAAGLRVVAMTCQGDGVAVSSAGSQAQVEIQGRRSLFQMSEPVGRRQVGVGPISTKITLHLPGSFTPVYDLELAVEPSSGTTGIFEGALWLSRTSTLDAPGYPRTSAVQAGRPVALVRCLVTLM